MAALIGAYPDEIFFTSGGTEADNWAIKEGMLTAGAGADTIITTDIEHHAISESCKWLERFDKKTK